MAEAQQKDEKDPSVEEILQSIRRIIAEDGDEAQPAPANAPAAASVTAPAATGSDVLELTDIVKDDGTVVNIKTRMPEPPVAPPAEAKMDVLSNIDDALFIHEKKEPAAASAPAAAPAMAEPPAAPSVVPASPAMKALEMPPIAPPAPVVKKPEAAASTLISEQTVFASAETFRNFAEAATRESAAKEKEKPMESPMFRSGQSVEDLVKETLRPLLKDWLDKNLPTLVQKVVEKEIRRIANTAIQD